MTGRARRVAGCHTPPLSGSPLASSFTVSGFLDALSLIRVAIALILSAALPERLGISVAPMASIRLVSALSLAGLRSWLACSLDVGGTQSISAFGRWVVLLVWALCLLLEATGPVGLLATCGALGLSVESRNVLVTELPPSTGIVER